MVALTEQLQALNAKSCKVVLTARQLATKLFASISERLGVDARSAAYEMDPECPDWLWDDDILAPVGEAAAEQDEAGGVGAGEEDEGPAEPGPARKRGRPKGAKGGRKIGKNVPTLRYRLEAEDPACRNCGCARKVLRTETAARLHYVPASHVRIVCERPDKHTGCVIPCERQHALQYWRARRPTKSHFTNGGEFPLGDGRLTGVMPRQSQTSNRTESSARERRRTPSEIGGQRKLPASGHWVTRTIPLPSWCRTFPRPGRRERNTRTIPEAGSMPRWSRAQTLSAAIPRRKSTGCSARKTPDPSTRPGITPSRIRLHPENTGTHASQR